jgi:hypothetical protein
MLMPHSVHVYAAIFRPFLNGLLRRVCHLDLSCSLTHGFYLRIWCVVHIFAPYEDIFVNHDRLDSGASRLRAGV